MRKPVVVTNTATVTHADLLVGHLRSQGIDAVTRTNLDRTTYAGLGGAVVIVDSDQRIEAELELMLVEAGLPVDERDVPWELCHDVDDGLDGDSAEGDATRHIGSRQWVRACGYVTLGAMAVGTVVPSLAIIWQAIRG